MAKITNTVQRQVVDEEGNIVTSEEDKTINWQKEPNYVKIYVDNLLYLKNIPTGSSTVLLALLKRMHYGNQLVLNAALKRQIAKEIDLSVSSINNAITKFVKGGLLIRQDLGLYLVNPHLFGKGEWKDIAKIRLEVTFDSNGKNMMAEIKKKEEIENKMKSDKIETRKKKEKSA